MLSGRGRYRIAAKDFTIERERWVGHVRVDGERKALRGENAGEDRVALDGEHDAFGVFARHHKGELVVSRDDIDRNREDTSRLIVDGELHGGSSRW